MRASGEAVRAVQSWERNRRPWRDEVRARDVSPVPPAPLVDVHPGGVGPRGEAGGRVYHRLHLPAHAETTAQLAGLYPFQAGRGMTVPGAYIGRDRFNASPFLYDPWRLYEAKQLTNLNLLLVGVIGSGKSSLLKSLCLRLLAYGVKFFVPADTKGEMQGLARAVGATWVPLGPGMHKALSPLYAPPRPPGMAPEEYRQQIEQYRMSLLRALGATSSGRELTAIEDTLLEVALRHVTRDGTDRVRQPTLPLLVDAMIRPTQEMADDVPISLSVLQQEGQALALRFRSMLTGALQGVFDGDPVPLDLSAPGLVIDISRIRKSDAAVALTMTCAQALGDLILTFSGDRWLKVLDEAWRQIRYAPIVRRISEGQKLARGDARTASSATLIALHRISDLLGASPEVRELAMGLLADTSTRILYNQPTDQLTATVDALGLTDVQAGLLPMLGVGTGLWQVGTRTAMVDHLVLRDGMEWPLIHTDSRMTVEPETTAEPVPSRRDAAEQMRQEIGGVA